MSDTMSDTTPSLIDEKKNLKKGVSPNQKNSIITFLLHVLLSFIIMLVVGFYGANFIYYTSSIVTSLPSANTTEEKIINSPLLDKIFPTKKEDYGLPPDVMKGGGKAMKGGATSCENKINLPGAGVYNKLKTIGIGNKKPGWPYNMYSNSIIIGPVQSFKNWIAESTADTYITNRTVLKRLFSFFACDPAGNIFANEPFQMFLVAPLMLALTGIVPLFTYFSSWFSLFKTNWMFALPCLIIVDWIITATVSFVQTFQYLVTLLMLPLYSDSGVVCDIVGRNYKVLIGFFVFLTTIFAINDFKNVSF